MQRFASIRKEVARQVSSVPAPVQQAGMGAEPTHLATSWCVYTRQNETFASPLANAEAAQAPAWIKFIHTIEIFIALNIRRYVPLVPSTFRVAATTGLGAGRAGILDSGARSLEGGCTRPTT